MSIFAGKTLLITGGTGSFAGWYIAGMITLGLILIMAAPYIYGVQAELYLKLKANSSVIY